MKWMFGIGMAIIFLLSATSCNTSQGTPEGKQTKVTQSTAVSDARAMLNRQETLTGPDLTKILDLLKSLDEEPSLKDELLTRYKTFLPDVFEKEIAYLGGCLNEDKKRFSEKNLNSVYKDFTGASWGAFSDNVLHRIKPSGLREFAGLCTSLKEEVSKKKQFSEIHLLNIDNEDLKIKGAGLIDEYNSFDARLGNFQSEASRLLPKVEVAWKEARIAQLKARMTKEDDEAVHTIWYKPKSVPRYVNSRRFMCYPYIGVDMRNDRPWIMLKVGYFRDDWIFLEQLTFVIDGIDTDIFLNRYRDVDDWIGGGGVAEWVDLGEEKLIREIASANKVFIVYKGNKRRTDYQLTASEIQAFKDTVELYDLL